MELFADYWGAFTQTDVYRELARQKWQYICPVLAIALVFACFGVEQVRRFTRYKGFARFATVMLLPPLIVVAVLAMGNYNNFGQWRLGSFLNAYEFYHYYMGSKYAPELHYKDLYNATLVADAETGLKFNRRPNQIKNLNPNWREDKEPYRIDVDRVLAKKDDYKALFTSERWEEFVKDVKFFKDGMHQSRWSGALSDKGYNGSPAWSAVVGGLLSNNVPTDSRRGMLLLAALDLILIGIAMCFVIWAYGLRPALLMLVVLGTSYVMSFSHMKGAYLRTDFTMPIIISICLIKQNRYAPAGVLMGYASVARVFPTVFLFGVGARMVWVTLLALPSLWRTLSNSGTMAAFTSLLKLNRNYIAFFACVALTVVALFFAPIAYTGDMSLWESYQEKITHHADDISPWRVGFKYIFIAERTPQRQHEGAFEGLSALRNPIQYMEAHAKYWQVRLVPKRYDDERARWYAIMALVLAVSLIASRGLKDHDSLAFAFVPCFFLVAPTYYYYIMLLIPMLFFAPYLNRPGRMLGAVALLGLAIPGYYLYAIWRQQFPTYYWHSVFYFWLCIYMIALALYDTVWAFIKGGPHAPYLDDREFTKKYAPEEREAAAAAEENGESPETGQNGDREDGDSPFPPVPQVNATSGV